MNLIHLSVCMCVRVCVLVWVLLTIPFPVFPKKPSRLASALPRPAPPTSPPNPAVIKLPYGHALLVGVGGSGRQSATRLAAYIADYKIFSVQLTKTYGREAWRDDMRALLKVPPQAAQQNVLQGGGCHTQCAASAHLDGVPLCTVFVRSACWTPTPFQSTCGVTSPLPFPFPSFADDQTGSCVTDSEVMFTSILWSQLWIHLTPM